MPRSASAAARPCKSDRADSLVLRMDVVVVGVELLVVVLVLVRGGSHVGLARRRGPREVCAGGAAAGKGSTECRELEGPDRLGLD